jgi:magnesium transporter
VLTAFVYSGGETRTYDYVDAAWIMPESGAVVWADLADPSPDELRVLGDVFHFNDLAVEDTRAALHHPKADGYPDYLYVILHGIDFEEAPRRFATHDIDFFLGSSYLVTVHDGTSRSIERYRDLCPRNGFVLADGPTHLMYRIVDLMVDNYRPEVEKLEGRLDALEKQVFERPRKRLVQDILTLKRDVIELRRVTTRQRDVVGRLARREFPQIDETNAFRFRDVYDHLVRIADEALTFQDRITSLLDAHLSSVSNRLNEVMKVLTVFASIFGPLTVLTSLYGMNVRLPQFPGGEDAQFWWIAGLMALISGSLLLVFRRMKWL